MFIGEYAHNLDDKKRLLIPTKLRKNLGKKAIITHGFEKCIALYPITEWKLLTKKLANLPKGKASTRALNRFFIAGAVEVDVDGIGRILIPDFLKKFASLRNKVILAGVHDRIEIWDEKSWEIYKARVEDEADVFAETIGDLGGF